MKWVFPGVVALVAVGAFGCEPEPAREAESGVYFGAPEAPMVAAPSLRRLTRGELAAAYENVVGPGVHLPGQWLPEDGEIGGYPSNALVPMSGLIADRLMRLAQHLAARAPLEPCEDEACVSAFLDGVIGRAFRRPAQPEEVARFRALYDEVQAAGGDAEEAGRAVLEAVLQSPRFAYAIEEGVADGDVRRLTGHEVASRLAFALTGRPPDEALKAVAENGLDTRAGIELQAWRLLGKARETVGRFAVHWLGVADLGRREKSAERFPAFDAALAQAMVEEIRQLAGSVILDGDGRLETLLTTPAVAASETLADVYAGDEAERIGVLSRAGWLAAHAHHDVSSPVRRGRFIRERLLCQTVPPPPGELAVAALPFDPERSPREQLEVHRSEPACAGCHALMDPLGFAFESFDGIGRFRGVWPGGHPLDTSGELTGAGAADGRFAGSAGLIGRLARSATVRRCLVRQWFRFAMQRLERPEDAASLASMEEAFERSGGNLRTLMVSLVVTDSFRYRSAP